MSAAPKRAPLCDLGGVLITHDDSLNWTVTGGGKPPAHCADLPRAAVVAAKRVASKHAIDLQDWLEQYREATERLVKALGRAKH